MNKNFIWIIGGVVVLGAFLAWLFIASSQPLPGQKIDDLGRGHVQIGTEVIYNSNPPTSGKHYEEWVRSGVYETPRDDRNLVHSLEHGYVILSYKCNSSVIASTSTSLSVDSAKQSTVDNNEIATSPASPDPRNDDEKKCQERKDQLAQIYEKKGKTKLIVIPRPELDAKIALTAWNYLDKFNDFDQSRIEKFIDAHLNMGPEKTME